jgi:hypothetical protein
MPKMQLIQQKARLSPIIFATVWLVLSVLLNTPSSAQDDPPLLGTKLEGVDATIDTTLDATLLSGFVLSGTVHNADGSPLLTGTVTAQSESDAFTASVLPSGLSPTYSIVLPAGIYKLSVMVLNLDLEAETDSAVFVTTDVAETVTITNNTTQDIILPAPTERLSVFGQVTSAGNLPTRGSLLFRSLDGKIFATVSFEDMYSLKLPAGDYEVAATVAIDNEDEPTTTLLVNVGTTTVTGSHAFDVTLPATTELTGTVQYRDGTPATPSTVFALAEQASPENGGDDESDLTCSSGTIFSNNPISTVGVASVLEESTTGAYSLVVPPGSYTAGVNLELELIKDALTTTDGNLSFPNPGLPLAINSNLTQDFTVPTLPPAVMISGTVTDEQNQPIADAQVSASTESITNTPNVNFITTGLTDSEGKYTLLGLTGTNYTVIVCPPEPTLIIPAVNTNLIKNLPRLPTFLKKTRTSPQ